MSNADLLDGIHGSASREANKYLALGADAMFPDGAVRNIQGGLDADKPASPKRSDMYIAWDTGRVYACFTAGAWTDITCVVGDVRLMAYNYSINEHRYIGLDPETKALRIKREIAATFLQLSDTPASYAGCAGRFPRVKAGEDGLEFAPGGVSDHGELTGLEDDDHTQYLKKVDDIHGICFVLRGEATTGVKKTQALIPCPLTVSTVIVYSDAAPTGASLIVDVNRNGATIFGTQANRPEVAIDGHSDESGIPNITSLAKGDRVSIDVDQVGSIVKGGDDLTVTIIC